MTLLTVGTRVTTEYGPGKVSESSARRVFIELDDGQCLNVATGTPGYGRIVVAPPSKSVCTGCQTIHGSDATRAVGRFEPAGPKGYKSRLGGPLRATRAQADGDFCASVSTR